MPVSSSSTSPHHKSDGCAHAIRADSLSGFFPFLQRQLLPLGLLTVAAVGMLFPEPGRFLNSLAAPKYMAVSIIFICSGLLLRTDEIFAALSAWKASLFGTVSILLLTPLIGVFLAFRVPMDPNLQLGLALFCCMPTTLSSGIALTTQARGNVALALLLTVVTNTIGIFTIPFVLAMMLSEVGQVELSAAGLLVKLCFAMLLPLALGRYFSRFIKTWLTANRKTVTMISNLALISIPWMKFSQSSNELSQIALPSLGILIAAGLLIHILFLLLNDGASRLLKLQQGARKAVVLLASQKTLPVAVTVLELIPEQVLSADAKGLVIIPCITFHFGQIFLDALLATRWSHR